MYCSNCGFYVVYEDYCNLYEDSCLYVEPICGLPDEVHEYISNVVTGLRLEEKKRECRDELYKEKYVRHNNHY